MVLKPQTKKLNRPGKWLTNYRIFDITCHSRLKRCRFLHIFSFKKQIKNYPQVVVTLGQVTWGKMAKTHPNWWRHPKKLQFKTSQDFSFERSSLTWSFEGLINSLAQSPGELWCKMLTTILRQTFVARGTSRQWRIKGGADWATARGPQHLGGTQFLSRKKYNMWKIHNIQSSLEITLWSSNYDLNRKQKSGFLIWNNSYNKMDTTSWTIPYSNLDLWNRHPVTPTGIYVY